MRKQITLLLFIIIAFITFYSVYYYSNYRVNLLPLIEEAGDLDSTQMPYSLNANDDSQNLLYSPGFTIAANDFQHSLEAQNKGNQIIDSITSKNDSLAIATPNKFLITKHGQFTDSTLANIREAEKRHLNDKFEFSPPWKQGEWFIFSHYHYPVLFKNSFQLSPKPLNFKGKKVRALVSAKNLKEQSQQFRIYRKTQNQTALEIEHPENGKLVLAKLPFQSSLQSTYDTVNQWIKVAKGKSLSNQEGGVMVPVMDFYLNRYDHWNIGKKAGNPGEIIKGCERISFSMNAEYSFLTSEFSKASIRFDEAFLMYHIPPKTQSPIFVMWVSNPEILMPIAESG